ncbi:MULTISPECIES: AtpZ/AtpI family protein [Cyanophyceae]|uniref:AtpZ/AtpI family protein n=1 Tax=Cyanophyceae TaxID=3028117 RepID=UPI001684958A|nr:MULTISPECIES: AtpZ/AtpI family protein [Cyanophyceae]MBD1916988.1 AtpZ/AtpI family protein [Phormidium sp. FACHB-77]MBD2029839.1 AtpZ/AtpI family protein [Phormidium sp. FACHB-322]MBD2050373.1 AtpZ/AtpI family protein [Leptolyngbya sp. FACHB-60]
MKYNARQPDPSNLSVRAQDSSMPAFLARVSLSLVVLPLGGVVLGSLVDRQLQGEISWAIAMALLGLTAGLINLWMWMKRPAPEADVSSTQR